MLTEAVERLIESGIRLAPCNWGYCVYRKELSACSGDDNGPTELWRNPDVCSECMNFCPTAKHLPWWEDRAARSEEFLKRADLPAMTRSHVQGRLAHCRHVIDSVKKRAIR